MDNFLYCLHKDANTSLQVFRRDVQRRNKSDRLVHRCRKQKHSLLQAPLRYLRGKICRRVLLDRGVKRRVRWRGEFNSDHQAQSSHVEDMLSDGRVGFQCLQCLEQLCGSLYKHSALESAVSSEKYWLHLALTLSRIFSSLNASATATAAAHATAFPAYVPP